MIEEVTFPVDIDFVVRPYIREEGTGVTVPTYFGGYGEVYRKTVRYVPDFEETNKKFAEKIYQTIMKYAKDLGEIKEIFMTPCPEPGKYRLYIKGIVIKEEKIEVPEHYGEKYDTER